MEVPDNAATPYLCRKSNLLDIPALVGSTAEFCHDEGRVGFTTIKLADGFDSSFFTGGQRELPLGEDDDAEQEVL